MVNQWSARVGIARVIVAHPTVVVADEPTGSRSEGILMDKV